MRQALERLCTCTAPSGFESPAADAAAELLRPLVDEVSIDRMGNVLGVRRSRTPNAPKLLLDAHLDEIGLIVTGHEKGFLRFASLGGVDARMLPALEVTLLAPEGPLPGVIDVLPPHVLSPKDQEKHLAEDKLLIDVGLSQEEAQRRVPPGTPAVFAAPCGMLGEHRLCGKALDDRSCAAIVIQVMEQLRDEPLEVNVAVLLAAQEEVGCRGAVTGAYAVDPEAAIAVDVTHGSTPDAPAHKTFPLNGGAAIGVGPNMTRRISDRLAGLAREREIPFSLEAMGGHSGTDAWAIQTSREGVATGVVSLPLKHMHTPVEVMDLRDAQALVRLLCAWVETYGKED